MPDEQARLVFEALCDLGGRMVSFPNICNELGTEDTTQYREGLNLLLSQNKIIKTGDKRGARYSVNHSVPIVSDDGTIVDTSSKIFGSPEERLVGLVSDGVGHSQQEIVSCLMQDFPATPDEYFLLIRKMTEQNKLSWNREKRGPEGYYLYVYPFGVGENRLITQGE